MKNLIVAILAVMLFSAAAAAQSAVYVVRHAEKQAENMNEPATPLSEVGKKRAENLAAILREAGITAIYVTDTVRARETARPLAEALGITPQVYPGRETAALVSRIRKENGDGVVLVVGHENTVGEIVRGFGYSGEVATRYGNLFAVVPRGESATVLRLQF